MTHWKLNHPTAIFEAHMAAIDVGMAEIDVGTAEVTVDFELTIYDEPS